MDTIKNKLNIEEKEKSPVKDSEHLKNNNQRESITCEKKFDLNLLELKVLKNVTSDLDIISSDEVNKANEYAKNSTDLDVEFGAGNRVQEINNHSSSEEDDSYKEVTPRKRRVVARERSPSSAARLKKAQQIEDVLRSDPIDLERLRQLAIEKGGLIKDELRRRAWPQLMQVDKLECSPKPPEDQIKLHKDYRQVLLDVNRSLKRFPPGIDEEYRYILMNQLTTLIIRVLDRHPHLNYYQGYHDVAITFLLVMGESIGFELVERLSLTHLQEFMRPSMERTTYYLTYLYPILRRANETLYKFLIKSGVGTVFCLPWLITWYAHTLSDYRNVVRLYDFFLATPYLMPMYIAVAIVLHREQAILAEECDMAMQHFVLSQVPDSLPFEDLLKKASELYTLYPPDDVQEEVAEMFKQKCLEEEEERWKASKRRRKFLAVSKERTRFQGLLGSISDRFYLSPKQKKVAKVFVFAFTATLATGLYGYYTNSFTFTAYFPWS